jgi:hypothetical protein
MEVLTPWKPVMGTHWEDGQGKPALEVREEALVVVAARRRSRGRVKGKGIRVIMVTRTVMSVLRGRCNGGELNVIKAGLRDTSAESCMLSMEVVVPVVVLVR